MDRSMRNMRAERRASTRVASAIGVLVCLSVFLLLLHRDSAFAQARAALEVHSKSFPAGGQIPRQFTCDGSDDSPGLHWTFGPYGTMSFAIAMNDPDAPTNFVHWLAYNIPAGVRLLGEGAAAYGGMPQGSALGTNSFGSFGYGGPCPPQGKPHHYVFRVYALDRRIALAPGAGADEFETAIRGHILAQGEIVGVYGRNSR